MTFQHAERLCRALMTLQANQGGSLSSVLGSSWGDHSGRPQARNNRIGGSIIDATPSECAERPGPLVVVVAVGWRRLHRRGVFVGL